MKYFILVNLFILNLFSSSLEIDTKFTEGSLNPHMTYLIQNESKNITPEEVIKSEQLQVVKKSNLGLIFDKQIWTVANIKNSTNQIKTIYLYNPRAAIDFIDAYVFRDGLLKDSYFLGDSRELENREIFSRFSTFKISLEANEEITLVSKISNPHGRIDIEWIAMNENSFYKFIAKDLIIWGIILSGVIFILIFQWFFYNALKNNYFVLYAIFSMIVLIYLIFYNGFGYLIFGACSFNNIIPHLAGSSILLIYTLFLDKFLNLSNHSSTNKIILKIIYSYAIFTTLTSWIIVFSPIVYSFDNYFFIIYFFSITTLIILSIKNIYLKKEIAIHYLLGQFCVLLSYLILALNAFGILTTTTYVQQQILGFSVLFEMFFFAYAISINMRFISEEKEKNARLFLSQSHFASIGQTLRNVAHQWKIPMVRFGTLVTELETTMICKKIYDERAEEVFTQLRTSVEFMAQTIEEFRNFYLKTENIRIFKPYDEIQDILMLLIEKINSLSANVIFAESIKNISISDYDKSFTHISMIILDNWLEIAQERNISNPQIIINAQEELDKIIIIFEDNCGGVSQVPITSIFNIEITSSKQLNRGSGLTIAKMLAVEKLKGNIEVHNNKWGATFKLTIPIKNQNKETK
jgi:hypothetical protein